MEAEERRMGKSGVVEMKERGTPSEVGGNDGFIYADRS